MSKVEEASDTDDFEEEHEKDSIGLRMKKNIAGKVMSSKFGKKIIPHEARGLLQAFRHLLSRVENPKTAKEIENHIIKLIVKAKICVDEKKVTDQDFLKADVPLRKAFNMIVDLYDFFGEKLTEKIRSKFSEVSSLMAEVATILRDVYKPHVRPKTLTRLKSVFDVLSNTEFYTKVWAFPDMNRDMEELIDAMNKYTQFNF